LYSIYTKELFLPDYLAINLQAVQRENANDSIQGQTSRERSFPPGVPGRPAQPVKEEG